MHVNFRVTVSLPGTNKQSTRVQTELQLEQAASLFQPKLSELKQPALDALRLLGLLHAQIPDLISADDPLWLNPRLNDKLRTQLEDPVSLATGALPDWCTALTALAPGVFEASQRRWLFEMTAFGVSETIYRLQSKYTRDKVAQYEQLMTEGKLQNAMDIQETIERTTIGKRKSDVASAAVSPSDGRGLLHFAELLMTSHATSRRSLEIRFAETGGFGEGLERAFYSQVGLELTSREQNNKIPLWLDDGRGSEFAESGDGRLRYLTWAQLLPAIAVSPEQQQLVCERFRFLGRLIAKARYSIPCFFSLLDSLCCVAVQL